MTQKELAEKIGVTDKAVSRWETGKGFPDVSFLIPLAEILGVSVTEMIRGEAMAAEDKESLAQLDKEQIKKMKPLRPILDNLSILGYVLIAAASSGYYELLLLNRGAPFIVWIALALAGGVCLALRNREYYKQHGSVPTLVTDVVFVLAVLLIPKIPLEDTYSAAGYSVRIMQVLAILFIPIYIYALSPWRSSRKTKGEGGLMQKGALKGRLIWAFGAGVALCLCYVLSRHDVLGTWHGMEEWPLNLFVSGLLIIAISAFANGHRVMISVPVGYLAGFILAAIFNSDGTDPGGGRINNGWIVWTFSFLIIVVAGLAWQLAAKLIGRRTQQ
jgi:transcriptional regulator with XRE-family HTH domain